MTQEFLDLQDDMKRIERLRTAYDKACNDYLNELLKMWGLDGYYGYWSSDRPGSTYHYGETHNLSMEEIIYCVENLISEDVVLAWEDYCLDASEFGLAMPKLTSWCEGCPRTPQAVFDNLRKMKQQINQLIDEEKERLKREKGTGTGDV